MMKLQKHCTNCGRAFYIGDGEKVYKTCESCRAYFRQAALKRQKHLESIKNAQRNLTTQTEPLQKPKKRKVTNDSLVLFEFERRAYNAEHGTKLSYGMYRAYKERGWLNK